MNLRQRKTAAFQQHMNATGRAPCVTGRGNGCLGTAYAQSLPSAKQLLYAPHRDPHSAHPDTRRAIRPVTVPRDVTPRADGASTGRPAPRTDRRTVRRGRARPEAGKVALAPGVSLALPSRRDGIRRDDRHRQADAPVAGRAVRDRAARGDRGPAFDRRHPQMAAAHRRRARFRDGVHSRRRPGHIVRPRRRSAARSTAPSATPAR